MRGLATKPGDRWRAADRGQRAWWLGLLAIVLLLAGSGWYQAWASPPYRYTDEQAHAGYVIALQEGHLPKIDTPIDAAHGGVDLQTRLRYDRQVHGSVWVANDPPGGYLVALGPAAISRALGLPGGPLMGMRLTDVIAMAAAAVVVAMLGTRLSGGDRRVGLVAGALMAAIPQVGGVAGLGYTDGVAILCSVAMIHVLVGIAQAGPTRRQLVVLSVWCALGAFVRPMTAVLAGAVMTMAFAIVVIRLVRARRATGSPDETRGDSTAAVPSWWWSGLVLGVPSLVLSGWYYARNQALYGDPTGSNRLLEKFERNELGTKRGTALDIFNAPSVWRENLRTLFTGRLDERLPTDPHSWWAPLKYGIVLFLALTAVLVVIDIVRHRRSGQAGGVPALAWLAMVGILLAVIGIVAQHWAGGGTVHARYLLPALAVLVVTMALPLVRWGTSVAGLALVTLFLVIQVRQIDKVNDWFATHKIGPPNSQLTQAIGPEWWRLLGVGAIAIGAMALVAALVGVHPSRPAAGSTDAGPAAAGPELQAAGGA